MTRGRYFTIPQAIDAYPGVMTERLIRRLVAERRIAFSYAGRRIVLAEADIEAYLEANRQEPMVRMGMGARSLRPAPVRQVQTTAPRRIERSRTA